MAAKQGFLMYYSKGDAIGTRVSVRYRRSGRLSEVVVKRGSTVCPTCIVTPIGTHTHAHLCFELMASSLAEVIDSLASDPSGLRGS